MEKIQRDKLPPRVRLKLLTLEADEEQLDRILEAIQQVCKDE